MASESGEITSESHYTLDENFRDLSGHYKWSQGDSIFLFESYTNNLTKNGEIVSATFTDHLTGSIFAIIFTNKEKDEQGNLTKAALVYEKTGLLKKLVVKKIEYYK